MRSEPVTPPMLHPAPFRPARATRAPRVPRRTLLCFPPGTCPPRRCAPSPSRLPCSVLRPSARAHALCQTQTTCVTRCRDVRCSASPPPRVRRDDALRARHASHAPFRALPLCSRDPRAASAQLLTKQRRGRVINEIPVFHGIPPLTPPSTASTSRPLTQP